MKTIKRLTISSSHSSSALLIVLSLSHVRDAEDEGEEHAEGADYDVAHRKEVVFTAEGVRRGQHEVFLSLEGSHLELIVDLDLVFSLLQATVDSAPEFAEVWQTGGPHPNNEVLVSHVFPLDLLPRLAIWCVLNVFELVLHVG